MFVSYKPYLAFDIERQDKTCICCKASEADTNQRSDKRGYCDKCYEDKVRFIKNIVGEIPLEDCNNSVISMLEMMRVSMMSERISYLVDMYFASDVRTNPYGDVEFVIRCYHDKSHVLTELRSGFDSILVANLPKKNKLRKSVSQSDAARYFYRLSSMNGEDWSTIHELCERRDAIVVAKHEAEEKSLKLNKNNGD